MHDIAMNFNKLVFSKIPEVRSISDDPQVFKILSFFPGVVVTRVPPGLPAGTACWEFVRYHDDKCF